MPISSLVLKIAVVLSMLLAGTALSHAEEASSDIPAWLKAHVGTANGKIAPIVLERARALYQKKKKEGTVKNPCYFAMDATRPSTLASGNTEQYMGGKDIVMIPSIVRRRIEQLDEPHAAFDQPPSRRTLASEMIALFLADSVQIERLLRFRRQVQRFRSG